MPHQRSTRLRDLDLAVHLADPVVKQRYVTTLFETVAPSYDRFTRLFSFGMDRRWKRELLQALAREVAGSDTVADLACGTGDLAAGAARAVPAGRVIALDVSRRMLDRARARTDVAQGRVRLAAADIMTLPLADGSVDAVTVGYGFRNAPYLERALAQVRRVLRPGGALLTLDFYLPARSWWRTLFLGYLRVAGRLVGWLWHREPDAYGYIAPSIRYFVSCDRFAAMLREQGFAVERVQPKILGGIALHVARRR